jgi:uncharacterized protein YprB with RNaseH-like and TPR domain
VEICVDLETSGLLPKVSWATCVGLGSESGVQQFSAPAKDFREKPLDAEFSLLTELTETKHNLSEKDFLIGYNSFKFDLPFLQARLEYHKLSTDIVKELRKAKHIDMSLYCRTLTKTDRTPDGYYITKDESARKLCALYVPSSASGAYLAQIYSNQVVTDEEHLDCLNHNSIDITTELKMHHHFMRIPDYKEFYGLK